jgi:hypothetical protein
VTAANCSSDSRPSRATGSDRRQRLERASGLEGLALDLRRHPHRPGHRGVQRAACVEDPDDRQLLGARLPLDPDQLGPPRPQPRRVPAPQLVELVELVAVVKVDRHETIQSWGYDTYPSDSDDRRTAAASVVRSPSCVPGGVCATRASPR